MLEQRTKGRKEHGVQGKEVEYLLVPGGVC